MSRAHWEIKSQNNKNYQKDSKSPIKHKIKHTKHNVHVARESDVTKLSEKQQQI